MNNKENLHILCEDFHSTITIPFMKRLADKIDQYVATGAIDPPEIKEKPLKQYRFTDAGEIINHCYHNCIYFKLEGGPGPVMYCAHPETKKRFPGAYENCIISHPDCDTGFPKECPLKIHKPFCSMCGNSHTEEEGCDFVLMICNHCGNESKVPPDVQWVTDHKGTICCKDEGSWTFKPRYVK